MNAPPLAWNDVGIAAALLVINCAVSWALSLGLGRQLAISAIRMTVQLTILGFVLLKIFGMSSPAAVLLLAAAMTLIAGVSAVRRIQYRFPGIYGTSILAVWASTWAVGTVAIALIVKPQPWYDPHVVIPLAGMVLGNSLTGVSLGLDRFLSELRQRRDEVEMRITLGASRWQACQSEFAAATRTAMIPILNTMSVAGIVSLPGMMTGQLLAGASPIQAVQYQIMIMFVIAAAIAIGVLLALAAAFFRVTTPMHQIDWQQITAS
jgi:putative ABC transport system permease protein